MQRLMYIANPVSQRYARHAANDDALAPHRRMVDAVFDRVPTMRTRYVHVLAGAGDPTLEIKAGGPISAFVEAAGEATKTGPGSSKPDILSRDARYVAIDRTVPFLRYRYPMAARPCPSASLSFG